VATDAAVRGHLLTVIYELRHKNGGWVPTSDMNLAGLDETNGQIIRAVCQHLSDAGLIDWKPSPGSDGFIVGMARIKGRGVDVIEGTALPSINITLPNPRHPPAAATAEGVAGNFVQPSPSFRGVAARGEAGIFLPDNQSWEVAAEIAARRRGVNAAALAVSGTAAVLPEFDKSEQSTRELATPVAVQVRVDELALAPTQYPSDPTGGTIVVQNFISIDSGGEQFREFNDKIGELLVELGKSNRFSGEVGEKLVAEIEAGRRS
jgi:hypothetical protein